MTKDELEEKLGDNKLSYGVVPIDVLVELSKNVRVNLELDSKNLDYFYRISVDELVASGTPTDVLDELREEGWAFDSFKEYIELYLKS